MSQSKRFLAAAAAVSAILLLLPGVAQADGDGFAATLEQGLLLLLVVSFGKGVATSLTPCVYPMIPVTLAVFGAKDSQSRLRSFLLALCYVEGMAVFYTAVGTPFALIGKSASGLLASPFFVWPMVILLTAMGVSFLGAFNLNLPSGLMNRLSQIGGKGPGGAFLMGLVAGPIAAPCTGPFLVDMTAHAAATGDPLLAAIVLFTYAHGIGLLFFALALSATSLPKSGAWMDGVKSFCAILLFVGAAYFLRPLYPSLEKLGEPTHAFLLGTLLVAVLGMSIGGVHLSFVGTPITTKIRKAVGLGLGVVGLIGAVNWYFMPERDIGWRYDEQVAFTEAREHDLHVVVDFGATWCAPCKEIEKIMADESVFGEMTSAFVPLKFDVTEQNERDEALQQKYKAGELPAVIFLDADGNELARYNDKAPDRDGFVKTMREVLRDHPPGG